MGSLRRKHASYSWPGFGDGDEACIGLSWTPLCERRLRSSSSLLQTSKDSTSSTTASVSSSQSSLDSTDFGAFSSMGKHRGKKNSLHGYCHVAEDDVFFGSRDHKHWVLRRLAGSFHRRAARLRRQWTRSESDKESLSQREDSLQFFKEEKTDGAIYNLYLKKVRYHTAPEDVGIGGIPGAGNSTFYRNIPGADDPDDHKAKLQWRVEEVKVIRYGSAERLVEAVSLQNGELDSTYVNMLLSTYRSFLAPKELLDLLLERYRAVGEHPKMKQHIKEAHRKSIHTVISVWMDNYADDFKEPPSFPVLNKLKEYATRHMPESTLAQRAGQLVDRFRTEDENSGVISVDDVTLDFHLNLLKDADFMADASCYLTRPLDFESISPKMMAAQLTYIDAELFKKVVPYQCLGSVWSRRDKKNSQASSVFATVSQFNAVSYRVIATVLKHPDLPPTDRVEVLEKWIDIAQELRVLKNFSSLKAIISGLRSNPVFRLHRVWAEIEREKLDLFDELSEVFSEEDNQAKVRELLQKEGTAKFADPENYNTIRGHGRKKSGGWGMGAKKRSNFDVPSVVQGTVPYLGTFLTDLTMVDTAIPDRTEEGLINVDKKRKEFEILAQIRMLQSAAHLYKIQPAEAFFEWFHSVRIYDDNESYELSCDIEPVTPITPVLVKGHKKKSSLGFFPSRRLPSLDDIVFEAPDSTTTTATTTPNQSMSSLFSSPEMNTSGSDLKPTLHHSKSTGSMQSYTSAASLSPWKSPESCVVKVYMETNDSHFTNLYKSIVLHNSDHTKHVLKAILGKFGVEARPEDFVLFQLLPDNELALPERGNVFYAMNCEIEDLKVVVRKKSDIERLKSRHLKGKARRKGKLTF